MDNPVLRFAWYRFRRTLRRRWGAYLSLALLVGLVGGLSMGAVGAARRTQSAFPSFLAASRASDLQASFYFAGGASPVANLYSPTFTARLARLPHVRRVAGTLGTFVAPLGPQGRPVLPAALNDNRVATIGTVNGEYFRQDRIVADRGRLPDPARADEIVVTAESARLLGWHVGQVIPMGAFGFVQVASGASPADLGPPPVRVDARIVGVVAFSGNVVNDQVDRYPTFVLFTPAFTQKLLAAQAAGFPNYAFRLDHGARDVSSVEREVIALLPRGTLYNFHVTSVVTGQVERATKPATIALGAFGILAGLAVLLIAIQVLSRGIREHSSDLTTLRALGADRAMTAIDALAGPLGAVVFGALVAAGVSVALSPIAPIGTVRQVDPAPGFAVDWTVLGVGVGVFVVILSGIGVALTLLIIRSRRLSESDTPAQASSRVVRGALRLGLPPAPVTGIRFAVERGRGRDAVPVGSALAGAVLAVAVVVTTLTFGSGLSTLVSHPALYGWNWDYAIDSPGGGQVPPFAQNLLNRDRAVAGWTGFKYGDGQIDRQTVPILIVNVNAAVMPPLLSGHGVQNDHEIVMGGTTLAQLHKHVGDTVVVSYGSPQNAPIYVPPTPLRIVGTATLPAVGNAGVLHVSMGTGAIVSSGIAPPAMQAAQTQPDPNQNGPALVGVKLRSDVPRAAGLASLRRIVGATNQVLAQDPNSGSTLEVLGVQQPAEIVNYRTMGATPGILAASFALGALAALGLTLVASVRRRRRDLALLKTLGFAQRQLAAVVAWQASVAAVVGIVVGVPVGVALGRTLWDLFAHEVYVVPRPSIPLAQLALVALGALVLANVVSFWPGRIAARTTTAVLLRTE